MLPILFIILFLVQSTNSCSSFGGTSKTYQNPTIQLKFYTPVSWTYPLTTSETDLSYFPQQPLTQINAQNNAVNDLQNALTGSLIDNQYDINLYKITVQYNAPQVNDCAKLQGNNAPLVFYIVEGGVVVKKVGGLTQAVTGNDCINKNFGTTATYEDFPMEGTIKIDGLTVNEEQMNQIVNGFITKLNFNNNLKFIDQPLIS
ncbi:Hypothetical protein SRAE_2000495200 [Strongyloides ratti]|uniref:Uncharacterized protein n=1 Tax=Strongyloides ratti TaxID=34506 RepID=A0A090LQ73_STRRB|nr:Hypothetical protein SRAE_2000495200 [Strongyloides ratti]CEF70319.1 Hypothetical protein SRAE_2000495200 [Strongyloides ratti]